MGVILQNKLTAYARALRKNQTDVERIVWNQLKSRKISGYKFRRQQPIGPYIVDFINFEKKLNIELDGSQHAANKDKDKIRDSWLNSQGYQVLRFWNNEVFDNLDGVLTVIQGRLESPSPGPSHKGRGG